MAPSKRTLSHLRVFARPRSHRAVLVAGGVIVPCTLGRSGAVRNKREGDGGTPFGRLHVLAWFAPPGPGRLPRPSGSSLRAIGPTVGWCDDPAHPSYNRVMPLPAAASHESMARADGKYDFVGVLDWNVRPRVRGRGSAIFLHINDDPRRGTEGCIALRRADMRRLLPRLSSRAVLDVR